MENITEDTTEETAVATGSLTTNGKLVTTYPLSERQIAAILKLIDVRTQFLIDRTLGRMLPPSYEMESFEREAVAILKGELR